MKWITLFAFSTLLSLSSTVVIAAELRAGAALSNITPDMGVVLDGTIMKIVPAKHVHDELHARCLVLDDGGTKIAFAVCDATMIGAPVVAEAKALIFEATQIPATHVLIAATHSHSAPRSIDIGLGEANAAYHHFLARRIADGVRRAVNNLAPAKVAWGSAAKPEFVFNRRWFVRSDSKRANPFGRTGETVQFGPAKADAERPSGPVDPELFILSVQHVDGRPLCVLADYGLHYIGGVPTGHVSADYFGYFANAIQKKLGANDQDPPFVGIMANGTSGDVNGSNLKAKTPTKAGYARMEEVAYSLAEAAAAIIAKAEHRSDLTLAATAEDLSLQSRKPDAEQLAWAQSMLATDEARKAKLTRPVIYAKETVALSKYADTLPITLQAFRIGDLAIASVPCEVFAITGLGIKAKSAAKATFTMELANGYGGYLPTPEQHGYGGYETWPARSSFLEVGAEPKIRDGLLRLIADLIAKR